MANAPVFGRLLDYLNIRETVALTDVDLSRAIPTVATNNSILRFRSTVQIFSVLRTTVAADTRAANPRTAANWTTIMSGDGRELGRGVPADHDMMILSVGASSDLATDMSYFSTLTATGGASLIMLMAWNALFNEVAFNDAAPAVQNLPSAFWSPANDIRTFSWRIGAAGDNTLQVVVIDAPAGVMTPPILGV